MCETNQYRRARVAVVESVFDIHQVTLLTWTSSKTFLLGILG